MKSKNKTKYTGVPFIRLVDRIRERRIRTASFAPPSRYLPCPAANVIDGRVL